MIVVIVSCQYSPVSSRHLQEIQPVFPFESRLGGSLTWHLLELQCKLYIVDSVERTNNKTRVFARRRGIWTTHGHTTHSGFRPACATIPLQEIQTRQLDYGTYLQCMYTYSGYVYSTYVVYIYSTVEQI
jgi:hypothetical protein